MSTLPRSIVGILLIAILAAQSACTPAATPSPTATSPAAKPTAASSPAAPAATQPAKAQQSPKPDQTGNWQDAWNKLVAAAKQEGKVAVAGGPGGAYREVAQAFQKAYPDIKVEYTGFSGSDFGSKMLAERSGEQYLWDVFVLGSTTALTIIKPKGGLDPLKPALILPDVVDSSKWVGGLDDGWIDADRQYIYDFEARLMFTAQVNRDMVPESELNSIDQLLEPKWKGKIVATDPTGPGALSPRLGNLIVVKGEEWLRKLLSQDLAVMKVDRLAAESVVRGRYPVGVGIAETDISLLAQQGIGANLAPLEPDTPAGASVTNGFGNAALINKAPHPNAAKVYLNWLLSQEGMKAYVAATGFNVRRVDVEGPPAYALKPNVKYTNINKEELLPSKQKAIDIAKELTR